MHQQLHPPLSIAILAGGQSQRMGRNKALLELGGLSILQRIINVVRPLTADLFLVTNTPEIYREFQLPMIADLMPGKAALGGIYTALRRARYDWLLALACDMPLLDRQLIAHLAQHRRNEVDVVCPLVGPYPETLHTFYRKTCLPVIENQLHANRLKITDFFAGVRVAYVDETALKEVTPNFNFLLNVNTLEDLAMAAKLMEADEKPARTARSQ